MSSVDNIMESPVARAFSKAAKQYQAHATLQEQTGLWLLEHIDFAKTFNQTNQPIKVLDIGCGTGWLIQQIRNQVTTTFGNKAMLETIGIDLSQAMINEAQTASAHGQWLQADMQQLPFSDNIFDLIVANLSMQWSPDAEQALRECMRVLKPSGECLITVPLIGSLREIEQAWRNAGSTRAHINPLYTLDEWKTQAIDTNKIRTVQQRAFIRHFESPQALLKSVKYVGANRVLNNPNTGLTGKNTHKRMIEALEASKTHNHYYLSYEVGLIALHKNK